MLVFKWAPRKPPQLPHSENIQVSAVCVLCTDELGIDVSFPVSYIVKRFPGLNNRNVVQRVQTGVGWTAYTYTIVCRSRVTKWS